MILKSLGDKKFDNQADPLVINEVVELMVSVMVFFLFSDLLFT